MRHLLNTLFVLTEESYLTLDGENVVILQGEQTLGRYPLHTLESILYFGYKGASPALMGACAQRGTAICFLTPNGRFLAQVFGETRGNVLLRKTQMRTSDDATASCRIARHFIAGKVYNSRWVLERATRDHAMRVDVVQLKEVCQRLGASLPLVMDCGDLELLRGLEGKAAAAYFSVIDQLILQNKQTFYFRERSRRPPMDAFNALLSFTYMLLCRECTSALESVGLDPYIGFLHRDRPGRPSLALDLMEELRPVMADRFVLSVINSREIIPAHCKRKENGSILLTDDGKRALLAAWQNRKKESITHPFLKEKLPWGLVPYVQSLLLARYLRGDLDGYPPLLWK